MTEILSGTLHPLAGRRAGTGAPVRVLLLVLVAVALPSCADVSNAPIASAQQTLLCHPDCRSHEHAPGTRRVKFLKFVRRRLLRSLTFLPLQSLSASLLVYLTALRGMRGGASALGAPSDFSHLGLSDLGQTSTAAPERDLRVTGARPGALPFAFACQTTGLKSEDLYNMKLLDLQRALRQRGFSTHGLKSDLVERLHLHSADPILAGDAPPPAQPFCKRHHRHGEGEVAGRVTLENARSKRARLPADEQHQQQFWRQRGAGDRLPRADDLFQVFRTLRRAFNFFTLNPKP